MVIFRIQVGLSETWPIQSCYPRLELWLWLLNILVHYPHGEIGEKLVSGLVMGAYSFVGARSWL